jgi:hypothetical protein
LGTKEIKSGPRSLHESKGEHFFFSAPVARAGTHEERLPAAFSAVSWLGNDRQHYPLGFLQNQQKKFGENNYDLY